MIKTGLRNPHVIVRAADAVLATITGGVRSAMKSVSQSNTRSTFRTAAESCQPECRGRRYQTRRTCPAAPWRRHDPCRRRRSRHCVLRRQLPQRSDTTDTLADWQQLCRLATVLSAIMDTKLRFEVDQNELGMLRSRAGLLGSGLTSRLAMPRTMSLCTARCRHDRRNDAADAHEEPGWGWI
jgi:hypothetical protein